MVELIRLTADIFKYPFPFMVNQYAYDDYNSIRMHCHDFVEIAYVANGSGIHMLEGKSLEVSRGDLFIINQDKPHSFYPVDRINSGRLIVYNCMFMPEFIKNVEFEPGIMDDILKLFLYRSIFGEEVQYAADNR